VRQRALQHLIARGIGGEIFSHRELASFLVAEEEPDELVDAARSRASVVGEQRPRAELYYEEKSATTICCRALFFQA
jgi:hypothetical protein